jgi:hypothetical protein
MLCSREQSGTRARRTGRCGHVIEEGLRRVLDEEGETAAYRLPDRSAGRAGEPDPLEKLSWRELRDEIYGGR